MFCFRELKRRYWDVNFEVLSLLLFGILFSFSAVAQEADSEELNQISGLYELPVTRDVIEIKKGKIYDLGFEPAQEMGEVETVKDKEGKPHFYLRPTSHLYPKTAFSKDKRPEIKNFGDRLLFKQTIDPASGTGDFKEVWQKLSLTRDEYRLEQSKLLNELKGEWELQEITSFKDEQNLGKKFDVNSPFKRASYIEYHATGEMLEKLMVKEDEIKPCNDPIHNGKLEKCRIMKCHEPQKLKFDGTFKYILNDNFKTDLYINLKSKYLLLNEIEPKLQVIAGAGFHIKSIQGKDGSRQLILVHQYEDTDAQKVSDGEGAKQVGAIRSEYLYREVKEAEKSGSVR